MGSGTLVYDEIVPVEDELAAWVKARKELFFMVPDQPIQASFAQIANYVNGAYDQAEAAKFLAGADAWIIACALAKGGIVVTKEQRVPPNSRRAKVPNICDQFNVQCTDLYRMMRALGFSLS